MLLEKGRRVPLPVDLLPTLYAFEGGLFWETVNFLSPIRVREGSSEECSRDSEGWFQATRSQSSQRLSSGLEDTALFRPSRTRDHQDHRMVLRRPSHARDHTS